MKILTLSVFAHIVMLSHWFLSQPFSFVFQMIYGGITLGLLILIFFYHQCDPIVLPKQEKRRIRLLYGGRALIIQGILLLLEQGILLFLLWKVTYDNLMIVWVDGIISTLYALWCILHGVIRILLTSVRLRIAKRWMMVLLLFVPIVHLGVLWYLSHLAWIERGYEQDRMLSQVPQIENQECATKYPLLLLHGVGFRDFRFFNYWGRIPRDLRRCGAVIYYGNQEAWGTIQGNGADIKERIKAILKETGSEKVNIIAHSKGGLDARYTVSTLHMAPYVASVTTISTPHRGCRAIDLACHLPESWYRWVAKKMDHYFTLLGDKHPDFYTASHQFSTAYATQFNQENPDQCGVYYQSYMSVMRHAYSHLLLSVPYVLIRLLEGANDGLVSVRSAMWGKENALWQNDRYRGISHGDIIDLTREDYQHFDVRAHYIKMVSGLKQRGF